MLWPQKRSKSLFKISKWLLFGSFFTQIATDSWLSCQTLPANRSQFVQRNLSKISWFGDFEQALRLCVDFSMIMDLYNLNFEFSLAKSLLTLSIEPNPFNVPDNLSHFHRKRNFQTQVTFWSLYILVQSNKARGIFHDFGVQFLLSIHNVW